MSALGATSPGRSRVFADSFMSGCGITRQGSPRSAASRHSSSTYLDVVSGPLGRYGSAAAYTPQPSMMPPIRPRSYSPRSSASPTRRSPALDSASDTVRARRPRLAIPC